MGRRRHFLLLDIQKVLKHFLHHLILAETVYKIHAGFPAPDFDYPVYHVKIRVNRQIFIQIIHILRKRSTHLIPGCKSFIHKKTPSAHNYILR